MLVTNVLASRKIQNPRASLLVFMKKNTRTNSSERHDDEDDSVLLACSCPATCHIHTNANTDDADTRVNHQLLH